MTDTDRALSEDEREALAVHLPTDGNSRLFAAVESILSARLAAVEAERDKARADWTAENYSHQAADARAEKAEASLADTSKIARALYDRAQTAEAEVESLRSQVAAVEALADEWQKEWQKEWWELNGVTSAGQAARKGAADQIRAALTDPGETLRARDERVWAEGYERAALDRYEALFDPGGKSRNPYAKAGDDDE